MMKEGMFRKGLVFAVIVLFICTSITPSFAADNVKKTSMPVSDSNILYVGGNGEGNYTRIQDAIDNASDGDTVFVYDDSSPYYENVVVDKSINLIGEDRNTTVIDGSGSADVVSIYSDQVNISGFMITHAKHDLTHAGVKILSNQNILRDNQISYNEATGILMSHSSHNRIQDNIMMNNAYYNIYLDDISDNNIIKENNFITEYWSYKSDGLWLTHSSHNIIQDNSMPNLRCTVGIGLNQESNNNQVSENIIFSDKTGSIGIQISESDFNNIFNNEIKWYEDQGISLVFSTGNNIHENTITLVDGGGISLVAGEYNIIQQNELSSNKIGIRLKVNTRYNLISACNIKNNDCGLLVEDSSPHDNIIYHNNFIRNNINAYDELDSNTWYNSTLEQGNYWDDYKEKYPKAKRIWQKGIWDTPYEILGGNNKDNFPLIKQWSKSRTRTVIRNTVSYSNYLLRFLERFPLLEKLF